MERMRLRNGAAERGDACSHADHQQVGVGIGRNDEGVTDWAGEFERALGFQIAQIVGSDTTVFFATHFVHVGASAHAQRKLGAGGGVVVVGQGVQTWVIAVAVFTRCQHADATTGLRVEFGIVGTEA